MRWAVALVLAGCGSTKSAPPRAEEVTAAVEAGEIAIRLEMRDAGASLVAENRTARPLELTMPPYLYAKLPGYEYPFAGDGCLPDEQYLFASPVGEVALPAGGALDEPVDDLWYLGHAGRPPPHQAGGGASYEVRVAPREDGLARLAASLVDEPALAARAFTIAGRCTPDEWLLRDLADDPVAELDAIEQHLRFAGYPVASHFPIFTALRARRGGVFP